MLADLRTRFGSQAHDAEMRVVLVVVSRILDCTMHKVRDAVLAGQCDSDLLVAPR